jgi:hypothetical protein
LTFLQINKICDAADRGAIVRRKSAGARPRAAPALHYNSLLMGAGRFGWLLKAGLLNIYTYIFDNRSRKLPCDGKFFFEAICRQDGELRRECDKLAAPKVIYYNYQVLT